MKRIEITATGITEKNVILLPEAPTHQPTQMPRKRNKPIVGACLTLYSTNTLWPVDHWTEKYRLPHGIRSLFISTNGFLTASAHSSLGGESHCRKGIQAPLARVRIQTDCVAIHHTHMQNPRERGRYQEEDRTNVRQMECYARVITSWAIYVDVYQTQFSRQ